MDRNPLSSVASSSNLSSERRLGGALKLPKLCRKAWVQLRANTPSSQGTYEFRLCYAELTGLHLVLSRVKAEDDMVKVIDVKVASFQYFKEDGKDGTKRYFIDITSDRGDTICFLTKNQGDMTLESSEQDYINWQRMLAASLNVHVLEQKQFLLKPERVGGKWERLGSGSFGHVFKAKLNGITPVAVKEVLISDAMDVQMIDEKLHVDFINEALILCSLQGPCLLDFYGLFWDANDDNAMTYYMVTELCEGGDLRRVLYDIGENGAVEPHPRLPLKTFSRLLSELFSGLAYMHQNSVVHRDIKPDNLVLLRPLERIDDVAGGILKIIDYGHSRTLPSKNARLNPGVLTANDRGTELYRAPETVATKKGRSAEYSTKVDIYAAGVICWEMWTRELPFAEEQKSSRLRVEQLVAEGHRPVIPDDCPRGYASLIQWCWEHVPSARASADQALEQIMEGTLFDEWPLDTPQAILDAVTTGYWKRCPQFEAAIADAFVPHTRIEVSTIGNLSPDAFSFGVFLTQIREAMHAKTHGVAVPLEAIALALRYAAEPERAGAAFGGHRDSIAIVVSLMTSDLLGTQRAIENCMGLVCLLSEQTPESGLWLQLKAPLLEMCKAMDTDVTILMLAARFFTHVVTRDLRNVTLEESDIASVLIAATLRHSDIPELVATLGAFLGGLSKVASIAMIARAAVKDLIGLAHMYIDNSTVLCTWLDLFGAMSNNALGSFEVVEAGVVSLLTDGLKAHPDNVDVAVSFLRVLAAVTVEPAHVRSAMHRSVSKEVFRLCTKYEKENLDVVLPGLKVLANCAAVPELHRTLLDDGAAQIFYKTLHAPIQHGYLHAEAFRMAKGLVQDPTLLREVLPDKTCDSFVPTIESVLALGLPAPITPGLELLCKILLSPDHVDIMRNLQGPSVLTNALTTVASAKTFEIPPVTLETLNTLCMDPSTSDQIVDAQGPKKIVRAMKCENDPHHLTSLVSCVAGMAQNTTHASKELVRQGAVDVLSRILLQKAVHIDLLSVSMEALRKIAEKTNCRKQFEILQLRRTIDSIVSCFENHAELVDNANAAIVAALPESAFDVAPHVSRTPTKVTSAESQEHKQFKVILVGDSNVGKSCIAMRACQQLFSPNIKTTLGVNIDFAELKLPMQRVTLQIYDTAGQEQYRSMTKQFYRGCHAALLVYDVTQMDSFEHLERWYEELKNAAESVSVVAVVGAKTDLTSEAVVPQKMAERFARKIGGHHALVSAVANTGIHQLFRKVSEQLVAHYPNGLDERRKSGFMVGSTKPVTGSCCA